MQNHITNTGSAIAALNSIIEAKQNELNTYKQQSNHSQKAVFFKQSEINNLTAILNAFTETLTDIETEFLEMQKQINQQKQLKQKLEGCLLVHGVPHYTISQYLQMPLKRIENAVAWAYHKELVTIDGKQEIAKGYFFDVPLLLGCNGFENYPKPKIVDKPIIPFNLLKEHAQTGTCSDKNFMVTLNR